MYAQFFGLAELPFRITPDPRFLWYSPQHQEAKQKILYHITQSAGPIYLLADIGTGKTTLARRIVEELSADEQHCQDRGKNPQNNRDKNPQDKGSVVG